MNIHDIVFGSASGSGVPPRAAAPAKWAAAAASGRRRRQVGAAAAKWAAAEAQAATAPTTSDSSVDVRGSERLSSVTGATRSTTSTMRATTNLTLSGR